MTLCTDMQTLINEAQRSDLQSVSGVYFDGFTTDFRDTLEDLHGYFSTLQNIPRGLLDLRDFLDRQIRDYGPAERVNPMDSDRVNPGSTTVETALNRIERRLNVGQRDYNLLNYLLGWGARNLEFDDLARSLNRAVDPSIQWSDAERQDVRIAYQNFMMAYQQEVRITQSVRGYELQDPRASKLFVKLDLSEWLEIPNADVFFVAVEEPRTVDGYAPLGRVTVWLDSGSQLRHVRSKSAKTFIRGQIAQRLRIEDIESNIGGFVNTIFDTDSEQAYSSTHGPC